MGRGPGDLQRALLAMACVNHRDRPGSQLARRVTGPDDGPPYRKTDAGRILRSDWEYPYTETPTVHLFYYEPLAWLYGFRAHPARVYVPVALDPYGRGYLSTERRGVPRLSARDGRRMFDVDSIGPARFRAAQVSVTRAMLSLHSRELCVYLSNRSPAGIALLPAGLEVARAVYESGERYDRELVDAYAAQPLAA